MPTDRKCVGPGCANAGRYAKLGGLCNSHNSQLVRGEELRKIDRIAHISEAAKERGIKNRRVSVTFSFPQSLWDKLTLDAGVRSMKLQALVTEYLAIAVEAKSERLTIDAWQKIADHSDDTAVTVRSQKGQGRR